MDHVTAEPIELLRTRTSVKWRLHPADVLPLFIAETDYPMPPVVADTLRAAIDRGDTGYTIGPAGIAAAFSGFAQRHWSWAPDPAGILATTDVGVVIVETLRQVLRPGDAVVLNPPVYPPFYDLIAEAGGRAVEVPLIRDAGERPALDLAGLERAFAAGARAYLLCSPHNPLGLVHPRAALEEVARLAARYDVTVVCDEVHAPLTRADVAFTPFLNVSAAAREHGVAASSASKAWNLAGLKTALLITASKRMRTVVDRMPEEVGMRASQFGILAGEAAFAHGDDWLSGTIAAIRDSATLLHRLLQQHLPRVQYRIPEASYLAWLDFRGADSWGEDPSIRALAAGVALNSGPTFGTGGAGHARLNLACSAEVLTEAIQRLAR